MEYRLPHYFNQFRCVAADCEDSCCEGWAIMIDDDSLENYKNTEGQLGKRLEESIDWKKGCFKQCNGRCAFLNEDNLCDIQMLAGENMLCDTCRDYPRHKEEYEGLREGSLSLSCIEAAKLILGGMEPVQFLEFEDEEEDEEFEDYNYLLFTKLMDARDKVIALLQNRDVDIYIRIGKILELAEGLQKSLDDEEIFRMDEMIETFGTMDDLLAFQQKLQKGTSGTIEYCTAIRKLFRIFGKLEVLKADWPGFVKKAELLLYGDGQQNYEENRRKFHKMVGAKSDSHEVWDGWLEHLMVYFIYVYFCGAVYDENILGKVQTAVAATLLVQELAIARWKEQGEKFSFMDMVDIAHCVSREIEHSDLNLERMEKLCEKMLEHPAVFWYTHVR